MTSWRLTNRTVIDISRRSRHIICQSFFPAWIYNLIQIHSGETSRPRDFVARSVAARARSTGKSREKRGLPKSRQAFEVSATLTSGLVNLVFSRQTGFPSTCIGLLINPSIRRSNHGDKYSISKFRVCRQNLVVWPCNWNVSSGTFTWHYLSSFYHVVLIFESVNEMLWYEHLNQTSSAVLSHGTIYLECSSNFWVCEPNPMMLSFKWNLFSSNFTWYYLFSM